MLEKFRSRFTLPAEPAEKHSRCRLPEPNQTGVHTQPPSRFCVAIEAYFCVSGSVTVELSVSCLLGSLVNVARYSAPGYCRPRYGGRWS